MYGSYPTEVGKCIQIFQFTCLIDGLLKGFPIAVIVGWDDRAPAGSFRVTDPATVCRGLDLKRLIQKPHFREA
jgi:hypothetical protein